MDGDSSRWSMFGKQLHLVLRTSRLLSNSLPQLMMYIVNSKLISRTPIFSALS